MAIKQSVVVPMLKPKQMELRDFIGELRSIGYPAVEVWNRDSSFEDLVDTAKSTGLKVVSFVGHEHASAEAGSHAEGFSRRRNHERLEHELRESIDIARRFDIPGMVVVSGHRNADESDYDSLLVCAEGLRRIAPYAEEQGINLNMEILNTTVNHPNYLCDNTSWAIALCELVGSPRVRILFDIYHVQIMEGNVIRNLRKASKWIGHYHTAGNPGRNDLDDDQELNYRGICRAIAETGYDLYVGHEYKPKDDALESLRRSFDLCDV
jgi:hydroxypyruvate isomerase